MKKVFISILLASSAIAPAFALSKAPITQLSDCVIQAPIPGKHMTGAFLQIKRHSDEATSITKVEVPSITAHAELHTMTMKNNVMTMSPMTDLKVQGTRIFRKGGDHVMLMNIPHDKLPKAGEMHTITLRFEDGTNASCSAIVKTPEEIIKATKEASHGSEKHHTHEHGHHKH